jgi:CRISPR system Cascade subunit CasE
MSTGDLFLTRLTLKRTPEISALIGTLAPKDEGEAAETGHRLVWSVMPASVRLRSEAERSGGETRATMLWRREEAGVFYVLGPKPEQTSSFFDIETKPFDAALAAGDRLRFLLRVHPTVDRRTGGRATRRRSDIVMDLLHAVPKGARAPLRHEKAHQAAEDWMRRRGEADGFVPGEVVVEGYHVQVLKRPQGGRGKPQGIGILNLRGALTVTDPERFLMRLGAGFGRAKAFGCGLMLIRRA